MLFDLPSTSGEKEGLAPAGNPRPTSCKAKEDDKPCKHISRSKGIELKGVESSTMIVITM
jgi:hypothetical protein